MPSDTSPRHPSPSASSSKADKLLRGPGISVILVETRQSGNIGSAARAMKNMGLTRLKLVAPRQGVTDECLHMAAGAQEIVERALIFETLEEALADEQLLVGTTSHRARVARRPLHTPRDLAPRLLAEARQQRVALLFGPERSGLDQETLARCQFLLTIPTADLHPVLNVAQAVMVTAYELHCAQAADLEEDVTLASYEEREAMFQHLSQTLARIGFFQSDNQAHMMKALRRLLGHSLTPRDIRIVRAICSQMEWFAESGNRLPESQLRPDSTE
ncbi:MAG TPA: RNA methyltransferase [Acidobacteriota bacterium]|nr:RNA methyltransferase [Acidobacteriota bacterium]